MKTILAVAGVFAALLTTWPAIAQQVPQDRRAARSGPPEERPMPPPARRVGSMEHPRPDEMTPEERRQLRRDIYDHGRDVYRDRRQKDRR